MTWAERTEEVKEERDKRETPNSQQEDERLMIIAIREALEKIR